MRSTINLNILVPSISQQSRLLITDSNRPNHPTFWRHYLCSLLRPYSSGWIWDCLFYTSCTHGKYCRHGFVHCTSSYTDIWKSNLSSLWRGSNDIRNSGLYSLLHQHLISKLPIWPSLGETLQREGGLWLPVNATLHRSHCWAHPRILAQCNCFVWEWRCCIPNLVCKTWQRLQYCNLHWELQDVIPLSIES